MAAFGDLIAQTVLERRPKFDVKRNGVVASYGFLETVVEGHLWYGLLERVFGPSMTLRTSMLKMLFDQVLFSPMEVSSFMVWTHVMEGTQSSLSEKLWTDLPPTMLTSYIFWIPASLINFYVVPFHLRALYTGIMCIMWDTFMSFATHNKLRESLHTGTIINE